MDKIKCIKTLDGVIVPISKIVAIDPRQHSISSDSKTYNISNDTLGCLLNEIKIISNKYNEFDIVYTKTNRDVEYFYMYKGTDSDENGKEYITSHIYYSVSSSIISNGIIEYVDNIIETRLATEDEKMFFAKKVFGDAIESLIYENR